MAEREESDVCPSPSQGECKFNWKLFPLSFPPHSIKQTNKKKNSTHIYSSVCLKWNRKQKPRQVNLFAEHLPSASRPVTGTGLDPKTPYYSPRNSNLHLVTIFPCLFYHNTKLHPGIKTSRNLKHLFEFCFVVTQRGEEAPEKQHQTQFKCPI